MKPENRARPSIGWTLSLVFFLLALGLFISYILIEKADIGDSEYSTISFTTKYTLDEMRAFAYKNSLTKNYRPNLYVKWNLSFNRIFEDSENK